MKIYLSPSAQEANKCKVCDSEEYHCNLLADKMEPFLKACGIAYKRNDRNMTLAQIVADSNAYQPDFHYAMHTNALGGDASGTARGERLIITGKLESELKMAQALLKLQGEIYPNSLSRIVPTDIQYAELYAVTAPSIIDEVIFHDNLDDATWLHCNLDLIAKNKVRAFCAYFEIPFVDIADVSTMQNFLEYLAVRAGCDTGEVLERLALLVSFQDASLNTYQTEGVNDLLSLKLINQVRDGRAAVNWGDFGTVIKRVLS